MNILKPFVIGLEYQVSRNTKLLKSRLEAAGPTYIKIGQFVSNRPDVFGKALSSELATLQDSVTPTPSQKTPPPGVTCDPVPFASASIAQVHLGTYKGKQVAVKIKRPEVDRRLRQDLSGFKLLMRDDPKFMTDFEDSLIKELDFKQEVRNAQEFARMYDFDRTVRIPEVYPEVCTEDIIVMDYVESTPGVPRAERLINMFLEQLLFEDVIHGDMHSGNIGLDKDGALILYDFGNVIRTTREYRDATREFVWHLQSRDIPKIIQTMRKMGMYVSNEKATKAFIQKLLRYIDSMDIAEFRFTADEIQERVPVILDPVTSAIVRSFSLLEGYCKSVDPGFSYERIISSNLETLFADPAYLLSRIFKM